MPSSETSTTILSPWTEALFAAEVLLLHATPVYYGLCIPHGDGSGAGLIGLRERAALAGGHVDVTVTPDDRFRLSAWLPWEDR